MMTKPSIQHEKSISRKLLAAGIVLLAVVFTIMMSFFGLLERGLHRFTQNTADTFRGQVENEAETIARLVAFEMSSAQGLFSGWADEVTGSLDLCQAGDWTGVGREDRDRLTGLLRTLWEKVTFNEAINGIELIRNQKKSGKYLTILYNKTDPNMKCPRRIWKLIDDQVEFRQVEHLMRINSGAAAPVPVLGSEKKEDDHILKYMPLYAPVPGKGAQFLGVVKVDVNARTLKSFLDQRLQYIDRVQRTVVIWVLVGLILAVVIGLGLFNYVTHRVTSPILELARLAEDFSARDNRDLSQLAADLRAMDLASKDEVWVLREAFVELAEELNQHVVRLIDGQRLMGLGTLAQGMAHEIFSPLTYVKGNLPILRGHVDAMVAILNQYDKTSSLAVDDKKRIEAWKKKTRLAKRMGFLPTLMDDLEEGTDRMFHIVNSLRDFAGFQAEDEPNYDVHTGLDSTLNLLRNRFKKGVTTHKDYGDIPLIRCQGRRINQVFMNLLKNAGDAIDDQGNIWIKTRDENGRVIVTITDDGAGIPPEAMDKLFQPFFTTKGVERGTGLGLSISKSIIDDNGGRILASNEPGPGATFTVELPIRREDS